MNNLRAEGIECTDVILDTLNSFGADYIFSSPGSEWPPIWEALVRRKELKQRAPRFINCRHEELAVSAAIACARLTRKLTPVFLHTTVGTLHAAMAIRMAYHYEVPLLVLAGESNTYGEGQLDPGGQWLRHLTDLGGPSSLVRSIVKWAETVQNPETLTGKLQHACSIALSRVQGPTFLTIPLEVMLGKTPNSPVIAQVEESPEIAPDQRALAQVSQLLLKSRSPLIVTEHLGMFPDSFGALVDFAEYLGIPVVESRAPGYLNFPRNHPFHMGFEAEPLLSESDLILLVGVEGPWHPSSKRTQLKKVVLIDEDLTKSRFPLWDYKVDIKISGSPQLVLKELLRLVKAWRKKNSRHEEIIKTRRAKVTKSNKQRVDAILEEAKSLGKTNPIDSRWACYVLGKAIPNDAIVVEELTTHRSIAEQLTFLSRPGSYYAGHIGGLGTGIGFALGVKLASPKNPVIALVGDGAFNYNPALACLGFAAEHNTPILIVVFNNYSYDAMTDGLLRFYPDGFSAKTKTYYGSRILPPPNYVGVMRASGGFAEKVADPSKLEGAFERSLDALKNGNMALLDIVLARGARRK
jgi:acetolactate synthase-1/2/3 large subunit